MTGRDLGLVPLTCDCYFHLGCKVWVEPGVYAAVSVSPTAICTAMELLQHDVCDCCPPPEEPGRWLPSAPGVGSGS